MQRRSIIATERQHLLPIPTDNSSMVSSGSAISRCLSVGTNQCGMECHMRHRCCLVCEWFDSRTLTQKAGVRSRHQRYVWRSGTCLLSRAHAAALGAHVLLLEQRIRGKASKLITEPNLSRPSSPCQIELGDERVTLCKSSRKKRRKTSDETGTSSTAPLFSWACSFLSGGADGREHWLPGGSPRRPPCITHFKGCRLVGEGAHVVEVPPRKPFLRIEGVRVQRRNPLRPLLY